MSAAVTWTPIDADSLPRLVAEYLDQHGESPRVAVDGPPCAAPGVLASELAPALQALGRPVAHVEAESFWRDASLRLEHGHEDVESYLSWIDADALRRETLEPFGEGRPYLTSLRDPASNRSTRAAPRHFVDGTVLLVSGTFLLGAGLPFDVTVHLHLPGPARARRTTDAQAWTLPAFDAYDAAAHPTDVADVTIRLDRRSPAVRGLQDVLSVARRSVVRR